MRSGSESEPALGYYGKSGWRFSSRGNPNLDSNPDRRTPSIQMTPNALRRKFRGGSGSDL